VQLPTISGHSDVPKDLLTYPEGAHCKVGNGWMRRTDMPDLSDRQWLEFLAENGHCSYQFALAATIMASDRHEAKGTEAFMWVFIAHMLGESRAGAAMDFLYAGLDADQIEAGYQRAFAWFEEKQTEDLERDPTGWSSELRDFLGIK
jgi:hypothetical protein